MLRLLDLVRWKSAIKAEEVDVDATLIKWFSVFDCASFACDPSSSEEQRAAAVQRPGGQQIWLSIDRLGQGHWLDVKLRLSLFSHWWNWSFHWKRRHAGNMWNPHIKLQIRNWTMALTVWLHCTNVKEAHCQFSLCVANKILFVSTLSSLRFPALRPSQNLYFVSRGALNQRQYPHRWWNIPMPPLFVHIFDSPW